MKKTLNVNLNGRVFTIDEDAYRLLDNYLGNLRIHFRKEEGSTEIIADFEARIEELFSEKTRLGYQVITFEHVEEVIARVGRPSDFVGNDDREEEEKPLSEPVSGKKKFYRNIDNKILGGVCSGLAAYFGWSTVAVRIILVLLPFVLASFKALTIVHPPMMFMSGWWVILAYLITWMIVPGALTAEQKLQMYGKPITVENIGKTVAAQSAPSVNKEPKGCLGTIGDLFVAFLKVCLVGFGCLVGIPLLFALFIVLIVLFAVVFGVGGGVMGALPPFLVVEHPVLSMIVGIIVLGIPVIAVIYSIVAHFTKAKPVRQSVKWIILLVWIVALILFFFSGFRLNINRDNWLGHNHLPVWFDNHEIRGNNIPSQKIIDLDSEVTHVELGKYLFNSFMNLQIEQIQNGSPAIEINGDENLVEQVRYELHNGRLVLATYDRIRNSNNLKITLRTNGLKGIRMNTVGNVRIERAFTGDALDIGMQGIGNFRADSLYVQSLTVQTEGVGSVTIAGKAGNARLETAGTGKIDALELVSDTAFVNVAGVGSIQCNPVEYLEGRLQGVGSITYKEEPKNKNVSSSGVGKIRKR